MRRQLAILFWLTIGLACPVIAAGGTAVARFEMQPPIVGGAPGGVAFPDLEVRFIGDGRVSDALADFSFDPARLNVVPTAFGGAICVVGSGPFAGLLRVIAPVRSTPFPTSASVFCRLRIELLPGAPTALVRFEPMLGTLECVEPTALVVPCQAFGAAVSIGPAPGTATVTFAPSSGTAIALPGAGSAAITANFVPGGAGDAIVIDACSIAGDSVFAPVVLVPETLAFAGSAAAAGALRLGCLASSGGSGVLTCAQRRNAGAPVAVAWPLSCPNTFAPPSVSYFPAPANQIRVGGLDVIDYPNQAQLTITIGADGIGTGPAATTRIDECIASAGFIADLAGGSVTATGTTGATATLALGCMPMAQAVTGQLGCREARASTVRTVSWSLLCPAGRPDGLFEDAFE